MLRKLLITGIVLAITIIVVICSSFVKTRTRAAGLTSQTLPDGTQIIIQAVTYGTNHVFIHGSMFLARLKEVLPARVHKWFGRQTKCSTITSDPSAVIWFSAYDSATQQFKYLSPDSFQIVDDHGCVQRIGHYGGGASDPEFSVQHAYAHVFPRRQKSFTLRTAFSGFAPLEFKLSNPMQPSRIKEWTPEPLPVRRTVGNTNYILSEIHGYFNESGHWFEPRLSIEINGKDRSQWFTPSPMYRDATGNRSHSLCPFEPAWKVEYEILHSHDAPFNENEILRITELKIPEPGEVIRFSEMKTVDGISLQSFALCGPGDYKFSNGVCVAAAPHDSSMSGESFSSSSSSGPPRHVEFAFRRKRPSLLAEIAGLKRPGDLLLRGRDHVGQLFEVSFSGSADQTYQYVLRPSTNATHFALELIRQQVVRLEYTVAPPRRSR